MNRVVEFMKGSIDFLKMLGEMSAKADESDAKPVIIQRKDFREMVATTELFYDMAHLMFLGFQEDVNTAKLSAINEHAKGILLQKELKSLYNEFYKVRNKMPPELMTQFIDHLKKTKLPTQEELRESVTLKNNSDTNGKKA